MPVTALAPDAPLDSAAAKPPASEKPPESAKKIVPLKADEAIDPKPVSATPLDPKKEFPVISSYITAGTQRAQEMTHKVTSDSLSGKDPFADYKIGTNYEDQVALDEADTDEERLLYLRQTYGIDNVRRDPGNRFLVKPEGSKKWVEAGVHGVIKNFMAGTRANIWPILGAGAAGIATGGAGALPEIAAAGAGAVGGKIIQEAGKAQKGRFKQNVYELARTLGMESLFGMGGQAVGITGAGLARGVTRGGLPKWFTEAGPDIREMLKQSLAEGGERSTAGEMFFGPGAKGIAPPMKSAAPGMKVTQFHQALSEKLVGAFGERAKLQAIETHLRDTLRQAGVKDVDTALKQILSTERLPTGRLGETLTEAVKDYTDGLTSTVQKEMDTAQLFIDRQLKGIDAAVKTREGPGDLHADVANSIVEARRDLGTASSKIFSRVDALVGDTPLVPSQGIKYQANEFVKSMRPTMPDGTLGKPAFKDPSMESKFNDLMSLPDKISFAKAQELLSDLNELSISDDLTPGRKTRQFGILKDSVKRAFDAATSDPRAARAVPLLKAGYKFYAENISKFDDAVLNKLVQDAKRGVGIADPSKIAKMLVREGTSTRTKEVFAMLPRDVQRRVAEADFKNLVSLSSRENGVINPVKFSQEIESRSASLETLYGKKTADDLRSAAKRLLSINSTIRDRIPVSQLPADGFSDAVKSAEAAQNELDRFMDASAVRNLSKEGIDKDRAVEWLLEPGHETRLADAEKFYGKNSAEMRDLREEATKRVFQQAIDRTESGAGIKVAGDGLLKALDSYTAAEKSILFPNGLDQDIALIAKLSNFWFPAGGKSDMAAGLAAGAIKMALPFGYVGAHLMGHGGEANLALTALGGSAFYGWLVSRPQMVRYLVLGLEGNAQASAVARASWELFVQEQANVMRPDTGKIQQ